MDQQRVFTDKGWAVLSHMGIPLYGPMLPMLISLKSKKGSLSRAHARQALSFQCAFLVVWVAISALAVIGLLSPLFMVGTLALGFALEVPQAVRAFRGDWPLAIGPKWFSD